ncbi:methylated-DNA--[protein]-cysteine S-methyltransferase [Paraburkholderia gardini]|uniref:Methylated-DNA--protein-cysteine methyltransferase n=1 Tax=Paraburkholderia gardini TaxID=2823469 RepID=A0ABN7QQJ9_9BURK|nr:methylated-DNA--[protein]-cysteine S-methyltransferase [Paraburkholderia gardini]CAG4909456.1 Methylated-DNA--protein-cysteine methyltransferase [Paraburkholderia gardini]
MSYAYKVVNSLVGKLKLVSKGRGLVAILWESERPNRVRLGEMVEVEHDPVLDETERQLKEYFAGERTCFDLELDFAGTTFQKKVWAALLTIPFGETRSYLDIATQIGNPKAVRAVGAANGRNPISIIAPCHRVIGASGDLTGFAGGLKAKETLLAIEAASGPTSPAVKTSHRSSAMRTRTVSQTTQQSLFDSNL